MRLPRFRVRTLMAAVAVFAVLISWTMCSMPYWRQAQWHYERSFGIVSIVGKTTSFCPHNTAPMLCGPCNSRVAEYHKRLTRKYVRAAFLPFLPVEPDPPRPPYS